MHLGRIIALVLFWQLLTSCLVCSYASSYRSLSIVDPSCSANLVQNGDFEQGTPTEADNDIATANFWGPIWQPTNGFSTGDFFSTSISIPTLAIPLPFSQNNFGGMWCALASNQIFREGIMNELSSTIQPNSGSYELSFKVACLGGYWGTPSLSAWGVNAENLATGASPTSFTMPRNEGFYGIENSLEIASYTFDADCDEEYVTVRFTLNTSSAGFPAAGINHIFFTRRDNLSGGVYIALDDVCLQPLIPLEIVQLDCANGTGLLAADIDQVGQDILDYNWTVNGVFAGTTGIPTFELNQSGTYQFEAILADGCSLFSVPVEVAFADNAPLIDQLITTNTVCNGPNGTIIVESSGGTDTIAFSLNGSPAQPSNEFLNLLPGTYEVMIVDDNGCTDVQSVTLTNIGSAPAIVDLLTSEVSCSGSDGVIEIVATGGSGSLQYAIDGGDSFQSSAIFTGLAPGDYAVLVLDENNCAANNSVVLQVEDQAPRLQLVSVISAACNQATGQIMVQAGAGSQTLMYALDGGSYQSSGSFTDLTAGSYLLSVQNESGCSQDSLITVPRAACPVYVPNVFSPNGDGVNDRFQVFSADEATTIIKEYAIFDRWGALLYQEENFSPTAVSRFWDGKFMGKASAAGTYVFLIVVTTGAEEVRLSGDFILIR